MIKNYFDIDDDFDKIIKSRLRGVVSIEKIPTGWTNFVFRVVARGGRQLVFRFPRDFYWAQTLAKESWFNKFINGKVPVQVAKLQYRRVGGRYFSMHEMIEGETLTQAYPKMNDEQKIILAKDIVYYIITLNKINISRIKLPLCSEFNIGFAKMTNDPEFNYPKIFKPLCDCEAEEDKLVLSHGDFNNGNIILDKNYKMIAVLDYAFACRFVPAYADLSVLLARYPKDFCDLIIKEYEKQANIKIDEKKLTELIIVRREIEKDYIKYMAKTHPDVVLPILE